MSIDVDVSISCDGRVDGKRCRSYLSDGDDIYCSGCAGKDHAPHTGGDETLRAWIFDNALSLTGDQHRFLEDVCESLAVGRPLTLVKVAS